MNEVARNPPSCLNGLLCTTVELPGHAFDGHGDARHRNVIFELRCPCGSRGFVASGWVNEDNEIGPPVTLTCDACEAAYDIFDDWEHGYDALNRGDAAKPDIGADCYPDDYPEPAPPYGIVLRFEIDPTGPGCVDCFSWITILAKLPDGELTRLLDWECA